MFQLNKKIKTYYQQGNHLKEKNGWSFINRRALNFLKLNSKTT